MTTNRIVANLFFRMWVPLGGADAEFAATTLSPRRLDGMTRSAGPTRS
ncbi:MAG: hypothetical protein JWN41_453, partial [Thermoleophilia bacterium]|nr:hypothetical protein [Thermoleophilia bacterium]